MAASCVAISGLFRVVNPATEATAQQAPSLNLGSGSPTPSPSPSPSSSPSPAAPPPTGVPLTAPVEVINASGVTGLGSRTAAQLRARGVTVTAISSLSAPLAAGAAVYYSPGSTREQAQALAQLTGAATISPAPAGLGSAGTLVLVLNDADTAVATALTSHVP